jgi:hypothetical protein
MSWTLDTGFTEQAEEHKSFNWIQLDNGQFAASPTTAACGMTRA